MLVIILLGKPSPGGANGVPSLPGFWTAIGPYLPPQNAFILKGNTVYFGGNGTAQALIIPLAYLVVSATNDPRHPRLVPPGRPRGCRGDARPRGPDGVGRGPSGRSDVSPTGSAAHVPLAMVRGQVGPSDPARYAQPFMMQRSVVG